MDHADAFRMMHGTLKRISDQFVNKDGMTGGRCVEIAQETLLAISQAGLGPQDAMDLETAAYRRVLVLRAQLKFALQTAEASLVAPPGVGPEAASAVPTTRDPEKPTLVDVTKKVDDEFARFFRSKGFDVTWDFRGHKRWYEIYLGERLYCQVDSHVPLADFLEDLPELAEGKQGTSKTRYEVTGTVEHFRAILVAVRSTIGCTCLGKGLCDVCLPDDKGPG